MAFNGRLSSNFAGHMATDWAHDLSANANAHFRIDLRANACILDLQRCLTRFTARQYD